MAPTPPQMPAANRRGRPRKIKAEELEIIPLQRQMEIRQKAEEQVRAERQKQAEDQLLKDALEEARRGAGVDDALVTFTLDLAEFADRLVVDGRIYFHGRTYTVPEREFKSLAEMAFRTHGHQLEIDGKSRIKHVPRNLGLSPTHGIINTSNLMRV